jgi:uncharacterized radical SAM superfamily Fe-S cluster-containing enzyme
MRQAAGQHTVLAGQTDVLSGQVLSTTESVCPVCLRRIPAQRMAYGDDVYLHKSCPEHGSFQTVLWRGRPDYLSWARPKIPAYPKRPFTTVDQGCPFDCGLCPEHRQQTCTALLEVTQRCNLHCPVCFADAGGSPAQDPSLEVVADWYRRLLEAGGPYNIQLSGGEPTVRDDLPGIVALGRSLGFEFIQINTNGLRLATDPAYVKTLKEAGLSSVFLQFDGTEEKIYRQLRGVKLLSKKTAAIECCTIYGLGVILVPTLVPGVNTDNIGQIIDFALRHVPTVRGVHFQPVSYFGRYPQPPTDAERLTIPEIIRALDRQTDGLVQARHFKPPGCENAWCSFHGNFVVMPEGRLIPWTKHQPVSCCCQPESAAEGAAKARHFVSKFWTGPEVIPLVAADSGPSLGGWDDLLARARTHAFSISGMAFQDAWNLDLERLRDCCIHTVSPDGRLIPFCAYNLTNQAGQPLYRNRGR